MIWSYHRLRTAWVAEKRQFWANGFRGVARTSSIHLIQRVIPPNILLHFSIWNARKDIQKMFLLSTRTVLWKTDETTGTVRMEYGRKIRRELHRQPAPYSEQQ